MDMRERYGRQINGHSYGTFVDVIRREIMPSVGAAALNAVAFACSKAVEELGESPHGIQVFTSANVIQNTKDMFIPGQHQEKGMAMAAVLGAYAGSTNDRLEILGKVSDSEVEFARTLVNQGIFKVQVVEDYGSSWIRARVFTDDHYASVDVDGCYDNVVRVEVDGNLLVDRKDRQDQGSLLLKDITLEDILDFADQVEISDVEYPLLYLAETNQKIARAGKEYHYGNCEGHNYQPSSQSDVANLLKQPVLFAAEAFADGCALPVVLVAGSANIGITVSLALDAYIQAVHKSHEDLIRALCIGVLEAVRLEYINRHRRPVPCGTTYAAAAVGAAVAYVEGKSRGDALWVANEISNHVETEHCSGASLACVHRITDAIDTTLSTFGRLSKDI